MSLSFHKPFILFFLLIFFASRSFSQEDFGITPPAFEDKYSEFVKKLEGGDISIDFREFRESQLESGQFREISKRSSEYDSLKRKMYDYMDKSDYANLVIVTKRMLSIDYTDMMAHKILRQTYKQLGDSVNAAKYKAIQFGLLNSIVKNGDGKTCATAWPVIKIEEEYFILKMIGAEVMKQSIDKDGGICDRMEVKEKGKKKVYYFDVHKVFEGYKKLFEK